MIERTPINTALIGFGFSGSTFHAPFLSTLEDYHLSCVVSSNPEKVQALAPRVRVDRIQSRGHEPLIRFYYMGSFYQRILRYWCELNQKWTLSAHLLLPLIAAEDHTYYQMLQDLWTEDYQEAAFSIHEYLFENENDR